MMDRRDFLKVSALGTGAWFLPRMSWADSLHEPHQLLHIHLSGAADFTYLFDARPMEMTHAKLLQNYMGQDPTEWVAPTNGRKTWATSLVKPLEPFRKDISIVNGIFMDRQFVGHDQNENILFTGNPFGGLAYMPLINGHTSDPKTPLDGLRLSDFIAFQASNMGGFLPFGSTSGDQLVQSLQKNPMDGTSATFRFITERMKASGKGVGTFAKGSRRLADGYENSVLLSRQLAQTNMALDPQMSKDLQFLNLFKEMSLQKSIRAGFVSIGVIQDEAGNTYGFDSHDAGTAKQQPVFYKILVERLAAMLNYLKTTPFSDKESLLDVTTVVISTEFGRTMRQTYAPIDDTGTDHNPFSNSIILAGKGIRGGMVIGESDFRSSQEQLSGAHLQIDKEKINIMGKPFDFTTEQVAQALPQTFQQEHYLNIGSVMNTVFDVFGMDKAYYRKIGNGTTAKVLPSLTTLIK